MLDGIPVSVSRMRWRGCVRLLELLERDWCYDGVEKSKLHSRGQPGGGVGDLKQRSSARHVP